MAKTTLWSGSQLKIDGKAKHEPGTLSVGVEESGVEAYRDSYLHVI
jgi:hypothetical protein